MSEVVREGQVQVPGFLARVAVASEAKFGLEEVRRICALPVDRALEPAEVEEVSRVELTRQAWESGFRLRPEQAGGAMSFQGKRGLFANLRVAGGKTILGYLIIKHVLQRMRLGKALLVVPSDLFAKAINRDIPKMRDLIGLTVPHHDMAGLPPARRLALARTGWKGLYVYTYSLLQRETAAEELALIAPELAVADECQALAHLKTAAQTKRFMAAALEFKFMFAGMSGTMAKKSILNYAHLALLALGDGCPLPRGRGELETWASALDETDRPGMDEKSEDDQHQLEPLRVWAIEKVRSRVFEPEQVGGALTPDAAGYQRAFRLRRNSAPGVVAAGEDDLGISLCMKNVPPVTPLDNSAVRALEDSLEGRFTGEEDFVPGVVFAGLPPYEKLLSLIWAVGGLTQMSKGRATTPNGDPISYAIHAHRWLYELSAGFYNELTWPTAAVLAQRRGISEDAAAALLERGKDYLQAKRKHDKELRIFLQGDHVPGLDTPALVGAECARGGQRVPSKLYERWCEKENLDFDGRPERDSHVRNVCDFKIRAALEWAKALPPDRGALVWTFNVEVGRWAAKVFAEELGPDRTVHCPSGRAHDEVIQAPETAKKIVVAALGGATGGHSRGKDLQFSFSENYYLQWPRSADQAQQSIGRTHREGQKAETLVIHTNHVLPFDHQNFDACLRDAMWLHRTEGEQKVIYADYVEIPKIHPSSFLKQRGFDTLAKRDMEQALREVFGGKKEDGSQEVLG